MSDKALSFVFFKNSQMTHSLWPHFDQKILQTFECHTKRFHPRAQKLEHPVQHNKQYHRKVLLSSVYLNGHTIGFHPQTQNLEPPCTA